MCLGSLSPSYDTILAPGEHYFLKTGNRFFFLLMLNSYRCFQVFSQLCTPIQIQFLHNSYGFFRFLHNSYTPQNYFCTTPRVFSIFCTTVYGVFSAQLLPSTLFFYTTVYGVSGPKKKIHNCVRGFPIFAQLCRGFSFFDITLGQLEFFLHNCVDTFMDFTQLLRHSWLFA